MRKTAASVSHEVSDATVSDLKRLRLDVSLSLVISCDVAYGMKHILCRVIIADKIIKHHQIFGMSTVTRIQNQLNVSVDELQHEILSTQDIS